MRFLLLAIGRCLSYVYPYKLHLKFISAIDIIYTGWHMRGFKIFSTKSKLCHNMYITGKEYIEIGGNVYLGKRSILSAFCVDGDKNKSRIKIGDNCMFGTDCHLTAINGIYIGKNLRTGKNVLISDNSHGNPRSIEERLIHPNNRSLYSKGSITIGDNVWIGEGAAILAGVSIGDGAIIGANTVVTKNVPEHSIIIGYSGKLLDKTN